MHLGIILLSVAHIVLSLFDLIALPMNDKESELNRIVDIVVKCCAGSGSVSLTREEVLGKSRKENVVMTRVVLAQAIKQAGYTTTTIASLLHQTPASVRKLLAKAHDYHKLSTAYRIAEAEAKRLYFEGN